MYQQAYTAYLQFQITNDMAFSMKYKLMCARIDAQHVLISFYCPDLWIY